MFIQAGMKLYWRKRLQLFLAYLLLVLTAILLGLSVLLYFKFPGNIGETKIFINGFFVSIVSFGAAFVYCFIHLFKAVFRSDNIFFYFGSCVVLLVFYVLNIFVILQFLIK